MNTLKSPCGCGCVEVVFAATDTIHYGCWRCQQCEAFRGWVEKPSNAAKRSSENDLIDQLIQSAQLNNWESMFLRSVRETKKRSAKQIEKLNAIALRLGLEVNS